VKPGGKGDDDDKCHRRLEELEKLPKGAWIAIMVVSFILFWPIGLGVLGYLLWSGKMRSWKSHSRSRGRHRSRNRSTGNSAFDEYRAETLRRLEKEQADFEEHLENLRRAKDKSEFDEFMAKRTAPTPSTSSSGDGY
jgi:hypothetical protein